MSLQIVPLTDIVLPVLGSLAGIGTIVTVYFLSWESGNIPAGVATPPISLLGCNSPGHEAYQIGFLITGLILLACLERWRRVFLPLLAKFGPVTPLIMLMGGYFAPFGVAGQGLLTLEANLLENLKQGKKLQSQSVMHQRLAGLFFLGAAAHCYATAYYIVSTSRSKTKPSSESQSTTCIFGPWSVRLKLSCAILSLLSFPIAHLLHPATTASANKRYLAIAGLTQYITVTSYIIFFGSYSLDFWNVYTGKIKRKVTRRRKVA